MPRSRTFRRILKGGSFFLVLAAVTFLVHYCDIPGFDEASIDSRIRNNGTAGVALYILITALGSSIGLPRQGFSFLGGYAFGAVYGTILATIGTTIGCACGFYCARFFARELLAARFARPMRRIDAFLSRAPFPMTLVIRFLPVGSNALTNLLAGVSSIPGRWFIAGSFLGYIPQNLIFSLLGSGMRVDPFWRFFSAAVLFVAATLLGFALYRRFRISQTLDAPDNDETA